MDTEVSKYHLGAMELLGIIGFSLLLGWLLPTVFWSFAFFPADVPVEFRSLAQAFLLVGIACGNLFIRFMAGRTKRKSAPYPVAALTLVGALLVPACIFLSLLGIDPPYALVCLFALGTGFCAAYYIACWLDLCGRTRIHNFFIFTSFSFAGGSLVSLLTYAMPSVAQPVTGAVSLVLSLVLLAYMSTRSKGEKEVVVKHRSEYLPFNREIEPAFFLFGMAFGISFVLLLELGPGVALYGILAIFAGSLVTAAISLKRTKVDVILLLRIMLVITVAGCLVVPFTTGTEHVVALCVVIAAWAGFTSFNYANNVRKIVDKGYAVFFHVTSGINVRLMGFVIGWLLTALLIIAQAEDLVLAVFMLGMAFVLVLALALFFPDLHHHDDALKAAQPEPARAAIAGDMSQEAVLKAKCDTVSKLYHLSPRESDILVYLVKGRNAEYICNKLVISSHTVKSHIYSIYHKTDIHSQQKLMDFIEDYPFEPAPEHLNVQ
ncbi:MAG: helix-turn-helix transcriptional regulator [Coriobacteriales bacterium]|nr:helix-turn-helix transcriptional regulator [Coriobacteriales bacterium]